MTPRSPVNALALSTCWHLRRFQLPLFTLLVLLQRTPVLRLLTTPPSAWTSAPLGQTLRAGAFAAAALGAVDTLAGATRFTANPASPASATVGNSFSAVFSVTGAPGPTQSYTITDLPPGLAVPNAAFDGVNTYELNSSSGTITGTPTAGGSYSVSVIAWEFRNSTGRSAEYTYTINVTGGATAPGISSHPATQTVNVGSPVTFSVTATGTAPLTYTWFRGTTQVASGSSSSYSIASAQTTDAGSYTVRVSNSAGNLTSNAATLTVNKLAQTITFAGPANQGFSFTPITLSASASSGLAPTFTHLSGPATLNGSTLTLTGAGTVSIRADQAGDPTYAAANPVTRSFTVAPNYDSWLAENFTPQEIAAGSATAPNADADRDGLPNLVEYALGVVNLPPSAGTFGITPNGSFRYTYTRPAGQTDVTAVVESSTNLVDWTPVQSTLTGTANGVETWTASVEQTTAPKVFFRLRVTRP